MQSPNEQQEQLFKSAVSAWMLCFRKGFRYLQALQVDETAPGIGGGGASCVLMLMLLYYAEISRACRNMQCERCIRQVQEKSGMHLNDQGMEGCTFTVTSVFRSLHV